MPIIDDSKPGAKSKLRDGIPYYFEKIGDEPLTVIHHILADTYEIRGQARLLPIGTVYSDDIVKFEALDEGSVAREIDAAGQIDWGGLSNSEKLFAQADLDFCRAVAQFEAGIPVKDYFTIDGEPARVLFSGSPGGSCGGYGTNLRFELIGSDQIDLYQLKPSGRFRVYGTVRVKQTGQTCKNGWIDKDGYVISTGK